MTTYIFGKLTRSKFFTPTKSYNHNTIFPPGMLISQFVPCKFENNTLQVFYNSPVFNSYLTVTEEQVYKLFSTDNKTTITRNKILPNTLYTFRVIEETSTLRVCEIYKHDLLWVGRETTGKLILKRKPQVSTPLGKGDLVLQNNTHKKKPQVLLYKVEDDNLHFVEINNPVQGILEVDIDSVRDDFVMVSNNNVRGVIFVTDFKVKDKLQVYVKEELLGFYIFGISDNLIINSQIEAEIVKKTDTKYFLKYQTYTGFIYKTNITLITNEKTLKGKIINIKDGKFELTQEQKISVPFDTTYISDSESEEVEERSINNLQDILNLIKKLTENKKYKEVSDTFYKYIHTLNTQDKDNLSLVYTNFLQYINEPDLIKEIKKVSKFCTENFLNVVGENSDNFEVVKFCYSKIQSKALYLKYTDMCYKNNIKITDHTFLDVLVDLIYKYEDNPRIEAEKIVANNKEGWMRYIENETQDYKRVLYRRVVNMKWKVNDMKEWYRMWMQYEKEEGGNVEEVRNRAKEYVTSIKK